VTDAESDAAIESPRDTAESAFTPILRSLLEAVPGILSVVFVDSEGECVDYCSSLPPFDAKVIAAHMMVVGLAVRDASEARRGRTWFLHVHASERDVLLRGVSDDYTLVVVTRSTGLTSLLDEAVERAVRDLRTEGSIRLPEWEPAYERVRVEVRLSRVDWAYAPSAFWRNGARIAISDVLGRWVERTEPKTQGDPAHDAVCFLVRTEQGHELTLVHRAEIDVWERREP
jgi:predicted regulator of Ras-like GTPase activity (Roadblock/LC7/MglB family)